MIILAKNNTASEIVINDLGGQVIPASGEVDLALENQLYRIAGSDDLVEKISSGDITINDGQQDFNAADGVKYAVLHPTTIGPKDPSGKLRVHQTSRNAGLTTVWASAGDDPTDPKNVGGGTLLMLDHQLGQPQDQEVYCDFNLMENETWLHEAILTWKDAFLDCVTAAIVPRVTAVAPGTNTFYNIDPATGVIVPAAGDGVWDVTADLTLHDGGLVEMVPEEDTGNMPQAFWNADWDSATQRYINIAAAPLGDGKYNLFSAEFEMVRFFNKVILLGNGFQSFESSDTDRLGAGMRLKVSWSTHQPDHVWQVAATVIMHRKQTR